MRNKDFKIIGIIIGLIVIIFVSINVLPVIIAQNEKGVHNIDLESLKRNLTSNVRINDFDNKTVFYNDHIYYINRSDKHNLYKIDTKSGSNQKVSDEFLSSFYIIDNTIIYICEYDG